MKVINTLAFCMLLSVTAFHTTHAQSELNGRWMMTLSPPGQHALTMPMRVETVSDSLHLALIDDTSQMPLPGVLYAAKQLRFEIPSGHGTIHCTLYKKNEDTFTGICTGPMGEGATTLKRASTEQN